MAYSRRFSFFEIAPVNFDKTGNSFADVPVTCVTAGCGYLWIGDEDGFMHCMNSSFCISSFRAHLLPVRHCVQAKNADLLVTVGADEPYDEKLCVWNTRKWSLTSKTSHPVCCRTVKAAPPDKQAGEVTCIEVADSLETVLLGHSSGLVQLIMGDLNSDRHCRRLILHEFSGPVTGLSFYSTTKTKRKTGGQPLVEEINGGSRSRVARRKPANSSTNLAADSSLSGSTDDINSTAGFGPLHQAIVFASSEDTLESILLGKKGEPVRKTTLDKFGCRPNCSRLVFDAEKSVPPRLIMAHKDAVYFYESEARGPCYAIEGDKRGLYAYKNYLIAIKVNSLRPKSSSPAPPVDFPNAHSRVTIFEYKNKFVAGEFAIPWVHSIITDWGGLFALCIERASSGSAVRIFELIEKDTQSKLDSLFAKKNFNLAIAVAMSENFGGEELAHIHRRCADHLFSQKEYDAAVKEYCQTIGVVEPSYVVLRFLENGLINQLARYLEALHEPSNAEHLTKEHTALLLNSYARLDDEARIDSFLSMLSTQPKIGNEFYPCVNVLRRAGYPRQALRLASLSGSPTDCVRILVEDLKDFPSALHEINRLPFEEALNMICTYGSLLIEALPTETAELLDKLCSNPKAGRLNVQHFLKIFVNNRTGLMQFLERYILKPNSTKAVSSVVETLLELVLFEREAALKEGGENSPLVKRLGDLAMHLLRDSSLPYGSDKALVLCSQRKFFEGCLFLWEKNRQYNRILGHHMAQNDIEAVISTCEKFGRDLPSLWLEALKFTADKPEASEHLTEILIHVEANNLASPLVVLKLLTSVDPSKCCKLGSVKGYLLRYLEAGRQKVEANEAEMQSLREETLRNREIVRQLKTRVKIFQQQKCAVCDQALQPPSVHFLCDHSYHEACFENYSNEDQQCPECTPRNRQLLAEAEKAATADSRSNPQLPNSPVAVCDLLEQLKTVLGSQQKPRAIPGVAAPLSSAVGSLLGGGAMQAPLTGAKQRQPTVVTPAAINRPQGTKLRPAAPPVKSHPRSLADSGLGSTLPPSAPPNPFSIPLPASVLTQAPASMASPLLQPRSSQVVAVAQKVESRVNMPVVAANPFDEDAMGEDVANNNGHNDTFDRDRPEKATALGRQEEGKAVEEGDYPTHLNPFA
ncbi:hypothetical protein AAHC03_05718 [Spirometra sp. Aus1]